MITSLENLSEVIDLTRVDRILADKIEAERSRIDEEIASKGYSDIEVDGQTFRITKKSSAA